MDFSIDHIRVPVPHALFSVRLARIHVGDEAHVLAAQLRHMVSARDVDELGGSYATAEQRQQLVRLDDINTNTGRCKLG